MTTIPAVSGALELPFRIWQQVADMLSARPVDADGIMTVITDSPDAVIYARRHNDGGLSDDICLWSGEARARSCCVQAPPAVLAKVARNNAEMVPVPVRDVFADKKLLEGLRNRLGSLIRYDPALLPDFPDWIWHFQAFAHCNLLVENGRFVVPPGWERKEGRFHLLDAYRSSIRIIDGQGRMGLMADTGEVLIPCSFAYLSRPRRGDERAFEAHSDCIPNQWEPCDLVDFHGRQLNLPGIKIRAGTLTDAIAVIHPDSVTGHGLTGYLTPKGELLGGRRWKNVRVYNDDRSAVEDPETGLWGYIDKHGTLAVPPLFARAQSFDRGHAVVATPESNGLLGLIDSTGKIVAEPKWRKVDWLIGRYFTVTDPESAIGVIDNRGNVVIEPFYPSSEEDADIEKARGTIRSHPFVRMIGERLREKVDAIPPGGSLASLTGVFSSSGANDIELLAAGLWGRRVEVVVDYQNVHMRTPIAAGVTGSISWYSPVPGSIFDLSVEAPVRGLPILPHASIGVPWELLRYVDDAVSEPLATAPGTP